MILLAVLIALAAVAIAIAFFARSRTQTTPGAGPGAVAEYRRLSKLSPLDAADALDRHVERLRRTHPGHELDWYLEQAVVELRQNRRRDR